MRAMETYPIMLKVRSRSVVVVGGGAVGLRKVRSLVRAGASVRLIAERVAAEADLAGVTVIQEPYRSEHLNGAMLVFACTDDRALNERIARDARLAGAIVNAADQPEDCDFFVPAVIRDGDVVVAVGTGGLAPSLAASLKLRLRGALPERIGEFADLLSRLREELKTSLADPRRRRRIMKELSGTECCELFLSEGAAAVRKRMLRLGGG